MSSPIEYIRLAEVKKIAGLGTTKIYDLIKDGEFPAQVSLGSRAVAWVRHEVEAWAENLAINARVNAGPKSQPAAQMPVAPSTPPPRKSRKDSPNALTPRAPLVKGELYRTAGTLDGITVDLWATNAGTVYLSSGPLFNAHLSAAAAAELGRSLIEAAAAVEGGAK